MNTRILGRTGIAVSEMSIGGLFLSSIGGDFEMSRRALLRALDMGVNYVDTAPGYFNSEEVLGKILQEVKTRVIISTKLGGRPQPFDPKNKAQLVQSVETSLKLLHREVIDILMIHEPDRPAQYDWWDAGEGYIGPVREAMEDLKKRGVIRFTGLGGTTAYELGRIVDTGIFDVVLTAFNYSLLWREAECAVLPGARRMGMGIVVGAPFQQGGLARRWDDDVDREDGWMSPPRQAQFRRLYQLVDETGIPVGEMALRFLLSNPDVSCVLTGVRSAEEVAQNVAAAVKGPLAGDVLRRIDEIAAMVPFRPYAEPFILPFGRPYDGPGPIV